jgi:hypothetical protein
VAVVDAEELGAAVADCYFEAAVVDNCFEAAVAGNYFEEGRSGFAVVVD